MAVGLSGWQFSISSGHLPPTAKGGALGRILVYEALDGITLACTSQRFRPSALAGALLTGPCITSGSALPIGVKKQTRLTVPTKAGRCCVKSLHLKLVSLACKRQARFRPDSGTYHGPG